LDKTQEMMKRVFNSVLQKSNIEQRVRNCSSMSMTISNERPKRFGIEVQFIMSISNQKNASKKNRWQKKASKNSSLSNEIFTSRFLQCGTKPFFFSTRVA